MCSWSPSTGAVETAFAISCGQFAWADESPHDSIATLARFPDVRSADQVAAAVELLNRDEWSIRPWPGIVDPERSRQTIPTETLARRRNVTQGYAKYVGPNGHVWCPVCVSNALAFQQQIEQAASLDLAEGVLAPLPAEPEPAKLCAIDGRTDHNTDDHDAIWGLEP